MKREDKELLLKDLCSRLPYGVKLGFYAPVTNQTYICTLLGLDPQEDEPVIAKTENGNFYLAVDNVKPYLFPLSSITDEQLNELKEITDLKYDQNTLELVEWTETHKTLEFWLEEIPQYKVIEVFDWLNKNHFDYRCLIERGLAIDATGLNIY